MGAPRLFSIPAGARFLSTFVDALLAGAIVPGVAPRVDPLALGALTIYTPTRRAARALAAAFGARAADGALLLPRIKPLGAPDEEETLLGADAPDADALGAVDLAPAVGALERRLLLADLVLGWTRTLSGAMRTVQPDGALAADPHEALVVGATAADAMGLAADLGRLIDEFLIEETPWSRLNGLVADDYSAYWDMTATFLRLAIEAWPGVLAERGRMEAVARRNALIDREIARLQKSGAPTIVLGSTGANKATARLMRAICRLDQGAVIVPGLDLTSEPAVWASIAGETAPLYGHPQAVLARLLARLDVERAAVQPLGARTAAMAARMRFVEAALAPGAATTHWRAWRETYASPAMTADVAMVEATDEREEATAIALALRHALETPGRTAALATPDRAIARRVRAQLRRWNIAVDDSGGEPLSVAPAGALARLVLEAALAKRSDASLVALVGHPHVNPPGFQAACESAAPAPADANGPADADDPGALAARRARAKAALRSAARALELGAMRTTFFDADFDRRLETARAQASERFAHPLARALGVAEWARAGALARELHGAIAPLESGPHRLATWVDLHRAAFARLRDPLGETLQAAALPPENAQAQNARISEAPYHDAQPEDARALDALWDALAAGDLRTPLTLADYRGLFERLAAEATVRGPHASHPRLKILGLLEARLIDVDLLVLAGLDEGVWPAQATSDAFLNRPMRAQLDLPPPERRIGQNAHDFVMAMGAPQVVLTRALKRGGAPTVASRLVQRLATLGADEWRAALARGARWRAAAAALESAPPAPAIGRPEPKPPLALRPRALSVTRIETLRRDPYAIYAERILRLEPLGPLDGAPGPAELGMAAHAALARLAQDWPTGPVPPAAREILLGDLMGALAPFFDDPAWRAFRWPRIEAGVDFALAYEAERRGAIARVYGEIDGALDVPLTDGSLFRLTARADRIERLGDGTARIVDYKTGAPPSPAQVRAGFASQLTLEAAMLAKGAFKGVPAAAVDSLVYLKIGGRAGGDVALLRPKDMSLTDLVAAHWAEARALLSAFRDPDRGYRARPYVQFVGRYGVYDHLARVKEWANAERAP